MNEVRNNSHKTGNVRMKAILRHFHATIVVVENQSLLHIFSVCL